MATDVELKTRVPGFVDSFNPLARWMLGIGIPMGPNALVTVRGRKSGQDRTTPVALVEIDGRRWLIGTFGETNWVRNLRAAGEATISVGRRTQKVSATELSPEAGAVFFRDVLGIYVRRIPLGLGRLMLGSVLGAKDILDDPIGSGATHPVFEVHPA
jgi:deazaflavin-dependent oxidoreductase (nitroreductase family)